MNDYEEVEEKKNYTFHIYIYIKQKDKMDRCL